MTEEIEKGSYEWKKERNKNFRLAVYEILGLALAIADEDECYTSDDVANEILQILDERGIYHKFM